MDAPAAPRRTPWVRSPAWDGFWVLSTLWLAPVVLFIAHGHLDPSLTHVFWIYFALTLMFWIGHRLSSTYLAYCTSAYRPLLKTQRTRFVWVPLGIVAVTFTFLLLPDDALPWSRAQRVTGLFIADYGLITYHFASQHFGFLSLYRIRAGQPRDPASRGWDRAYALIVGGLVVFLAEIVAGTVFFQELWVDPLIDPAWLDTHYPAFQRWGTGFVVIATVWMAFRELRTVRPSVPRLLYMTCVSGIVIAAFYINPYLFILLWTTQHWMAAMGLATVVARGDRPAARSRWYRTWGAVSRRPWALTAVLIVVSALLLPVMEVEALDEGDRGFTGEVLPRVASALATTSWLPALVALGFVTGFVHYALDRAVFRLSNGEVREAAHALFERR